jgi:kynurenine formamidase
MTRIEDLMRIVDLSRLISTDTKVFPNSLPPSFIDWTKIDVHGYDSEMVFLSTHTGTHMDAPSHFLKNVSSIDQIDVDRLVCNALIVRVDKHTDEYITLEDVRRVPDDISNQAIIFSTGWEHEITREDFFSHNPGLSSELAQYLVEHKINAVGIDSPSVDGGSAHDFPVHKILLSSGIIVIENLCNLNKIPQERFILIVAPLKLKNASGSPIRAIAITGENLLRY